MKFCSCQYTSGIITGARLDSCPPGSLPRYHPVDCLDGMKIHCTDHIQDHWLLFTSVWPGLAWPGCTWSLVIVDVSLAVDSALSNSLSYPQLKSHLSFDSQSLSPRYSSKLCPLDQNIIPHPWTPRQHSHDFPQRTWRIQSGGHFRHIPVYHSREK